MALIHSLKDAERIAKLNGTVKSIDKFPCVYGPRAFFYVLRLADGTTIKENIG